MKEPSCIYCRNEFSASKLDFPYNKKISYLCKNCLFSISEDNLHLQIFGCKINDKNYVLKLDYSTNKSEILKIETYVVSIITFNIILDINPFNIKQKIKKILTFE